MSLSNQSIVNRSYIENEALVSTVYFRVQPAVSWERSITFDMQILSFEFVFFLSRVHFDLVPRPV